MSRSGRYGTAFEEIEDESGSIKKRPKRIHEEEVKDEKGRKRFHGAFTGGFSAGYFNTVGSKHGFVPQTFKSSRDQRADVSQYRPEDFMDDEDFGEFGIAKRTFHVNRMYVDSGIPEGQAVWDRPSTKDTAAAADLSDFFKVSIKPETSTSMGFKIMKKMGYREGKGIGAPLTRRQLELQKLHEERARGKKSRFDKTTVEEVEEFAAGFEFLPEDIPPIYFTCKENQHGLGYQPLKGLSHGNQEILKEKRPKRSEAFGVGAFEDSDEDIYEINDMSKYTFELTNKLDIDPMMLALTAGKSSSFTTNFLPAKNPRKKPPHLTLTVPPGFNPAHKTILFDSSKLPSNILSYGTSMTPFERAMILGEKNMSVLDMLNQEDREKLKNARRIAEEKKAAAPVKQEIEDDPFIEDDEKSYRFKKYIQCLKRGVACGIPDNISSSQWQVEEMEFQNAIPSHLRYLLPDVKERKQPLYKGNFAKSIMEQMKSKFTTTDDNKVTAVKPTALDPFTQHEWHPSSRLCKRLKVADPFPESNMEGMFGAKVKNKGPKATYEFTRSKVEEELANRHHEKHHVKEEVKEVNSVADASSLPDPLLNFLDMMDQLYGTNEEEIEEGEKLEKEFHKPAPKPRQLSPTPVAPPIPIQSNQKSIFDVEEEIYGPAIPENLKNRRNLSPEIKNEVIEEKNADDYVDARKIRDSSSETENEKQKRRSSSSKKHKKDRKKGHKEKKSKHKKRKEKESKKSSKKSSSKEHRKKKNKHRSRSSSTSSSSSVEIMNK